MYLRVRTRRAMVMMSLMLLSYACFCCWHASTYDLDYNCCRHMAEREEDWIEKHFNQIDVKLVRAQTEDNKKAHMWLSIFGFEIDSVWLVPIWFEDDFCRLRMEFDDYKEYQESGLP